MKKWLLVLAVVCLSLLPVKAFAIDDPDAIQIVNAWAYQGVILDSDWLVLVEYDIEYSTTPDEYINHAYMGRFLSGAGVELNSSEIYTYWNNGYDKGLYSFYWSPSSVTALGLTWELATYQITLQGNPSYFADPPSVTIESDAINWRSTAAPHFWLKKDLIDIAEELEESWVDGSTSVDLITATSEGTQFTEEYGEVYFEGAIPRLRLMLPRMFLGSAGEAAFPEDRTYTGSYISTIQNFWQGTAFDDAFQNWADAMQVSKIFVSTIALILIIGAVSYWAFKRTNSPEVVLIVFALLTPVGAVVGFTSFVVAGVVVIFSVFGIGYALYYRNA